MTDNEALNRIVAILESIEMRFAEKFPTYAECTASSELSLKDVRNAAKKAGRMVGEATTQPSQTSQ